MSENSSVTVEVWNSQVGGWMIVEHVSGINAAQAHIRQCVKDARQGGWEAATFRIVTTTVEAINVDGTELSPTERNEMIAGRI